MASIKSILILIVSLVSFVYTFYVVGRLMMFLSAPRSVSKAYTWVFYLLDNKSRLETAYGPIVFDLLYVLGFIFQHSLMKSAIVNKMFETLGLATAERAIYCLTSSLCLHHLINNWISAQTIVLWHVDVEKSNVLWWTFALVHTFAWAVIYGGSIIMDLPELLGVKQAYYDIKGNRVPTSYKSLQLRNLYAHVRHPSFTGFTCILWATNLMTLDRLLLAIMLTVYMYVAWSTDANDVRYQKQELRRKMQKLKSLF